LSCNDQIPYMTYYEVELKPKLEGYSTLMNSMRTGMSALQ